MVIVLAENKAATRYGLISTGGTLLPGHQCPRAAANSCNRHRYSFITQADSGELRFCGSPSVDAGRGAPFAALSEMGAHCIVVLMMDVL